MIHETAIIYGAVRIGKNAVICENVIIGYPTAEMLRSIRKRERTAEKGEERRERIRGAAAEGREKETVKTAEQIEWKGEESEGEEGEGRKLRTIIGDNAIIRSNTVIYRGVEIGDDFETGHNVVIREGTKIGNNVLVGTNTVIEGNTIIGNNVRIQSCAFIPINTRIEDDVFIGPNAVLTNDKYPLRMEEPLEGPRIRRGASVGANAVILPGVEIGEGAFVAAGAVVTKDVPAWTLAVGSPAKFLPLKEHLNVLNRIRKRE